MKGKVKLLKVDKEHYGDYYVPKNTDLSYYVLTGNSKYYGIDFPSYTAGQQIDIEYKFKLQTITSSDGGVWGNFSLFGMYRKSNATNFRFYVGNGYQNITYSFNNSTINTLKLSANTTTKLTINSSTFTRSAYPSTQKLTFYLGSTGNYNQYNKSYVYSLSIKTDQADYHYYPAVSKAGVYGLYCKENQTFYSGNGTGMTGNFTYK